MTLSLAEFLFNFWVILGKVRLDRVKDMEVQDNEKFMLGFSEEPKVPSPLQSQSSSCVVQKYLTYSEMFHACWKGNLVQAEL